MDQQAATVVRTVQHYHDDWRSIMRPHRAPDCHQERLGRGSAVAHPAHGHQRAGREDTTRPDEYCGDSYLLVTRSRFNFHEYDLISAERRDVLRQDGDSFKLARREIIVDQAVLGTPNLAIFL